MATGTKSEVDEGSVAASDLNTTIVVHELKIISLILLLVGFTAASTTACPLPLKLSGLVGRMAHRDERENVR